MVSTWVLFLSVPILAAAPPPRARVAETRGARGNHLISQGLFDYCSMNRRSVVLGLYDFKGNSSRLDCRRRLVSVRVWTAGNMSPVVPYSVQRGFDDENKAYTSDCKPGGQASPGGEKARVYQGYPEEE
jgi:hypothetical protein